MLDSGVLWRQHLTRLTHNTYVAPHSLKLDGMSRAEIIAIATRPYRFQHSLDYAGAQPSVPFPSSVANNLVPTIDVRPVSSTMSSCGLAFSAQPYGDYVYGGVQVLPGGRWIIAATKVIGRQVHLNCWDLLSRSQSGVLSPVAVYQIEERVGPEPNMVVQHDRVEERINILLRSADGESVKVGFSEIVVLNGRY